jgi:hypothetical protein
MNTETQNFRFFLQAELVRRCQANPQYSLRAFARTLKLDPSRLSKILKGQRPVSRALVEELGSRLGLSIEKIELYKDGAASGMTAEISQTHYLQLAQDTFEIIANWHHYAILELMKVANFSPSPRWLAQSLGVTVSEINICIERLVRVELLSIQKDGKWIDRSGGFSTHVLGPNYTSYAHRKMQEQILQMAAQALHQTPIERRDQSSMMMAISAKRIAEAKTLITAFRRKLCDFLEQDKKKDSVYQLSISLFPLVETKSFERKPR